MVTALGERVRDRLAATGRYAAQNQKQVFAIVAVTALLALAVGLAGVQMSMGMTLYIDDDSATMHDWETLKDDFETGNNVFVLVESDRPHDPETIRAIDRLDSRYSSNVKDVERVTSLADVVRAGNGGTIPETEAGVERAIDRVESRNPESAAMVDRLQPETGTTVILVSYGEVDRFDRGAFLPTRGADVIYSEIDSETEAAVTPPGVSITVTGQPVFENAAFGLMLPEMIGLFAGAFALIFGVVYAVMRRKVERGWHVLLPLGTAMTALVYMFGAMGALGYDFNAIMLGVMPIALGLGIDYGLQIHTRYVEERHGGDSPTEAAAMATRTTGRALLIAMGTTVVGLGSLLVSAVPPVRQFGVTSALAVLAAMILSVTLLPALLVRYDRGGYGNEGDERVGSGPEDDRLEAATRRFTTNVTGGRPLLTLFLAVLLVSGGAYAYPQVEPKEEMMDFWPQDLEEKNDMERLADTVESPKVIYVLIETDRAYTPETFREIATYQRLMLENDRVNSVQSPVTRVQLANGGRIPETEAELDRHLGAGSDGSELAVSRPPDENPSTVLVTFYVDDIEGEIVRTLIGEFEGNAELAVEGADDVQVTGKPVLNRNVIENVTAGLTPMTLLSFGLGLVFLSLAFLSPRIAVTLIASVAGSAALLVTGAMYVLSIPWNPLTITMSSLTLGIGVDYGIHLFERYEFEIESHGVDRLTAASTAVSKLSRPIIGSSFTTIFGFGVLTISRFPVLANFGKTTVLAIAFSLLTAFTVLPAALTVVHLVDRTSTDTDPDASDE
ncbi:MMPL family transporter [Natronomonas sp. F2-12]|jgi:hydrophobe/amphiphile efflux-3 (HAE3) family protein|uniref:MMPL family transporter n=1 Tax=Natronomonas aquatica TaxID=2841590 RepID=A0A9R1D7C2_9EURY|nr:MMPL family transporter [Natronomonas aquatica]MCQ4334573.1 MMPL family transporter [Natronomonas aquatica]